MRTLQKDLSFARAVGKKIGKARIKRRWPISRLAEESGLSYACCWNIEHGENVPTLDSFLAIAGALQVDHVKLLPE